MRGLLLAAVAAATMGSAKAEDWTGFYAGVFTDQSFANTQSRFDAGVLAGARFMPLDNIVLGVEVQAGTTLNDFTPAAHGFLRVAAGLPVLDNALLYGFVAAGGHWREVWGTTSSLRGGAGVEFAANDVVHFRAEAYAARELTAIAPRTYYGLQAAVLFQFN